jgi:hypothetical protein
MGFFYRLFGFQNKIPDSRSKTVALPEAPAFWRLVEPKKERCTPNAHGRNIYGGGSAKPVEGGGNDSSWRIRGCVGGPCADGRG